MSFPHRRVLAHHLVETRLHSTYFSFNWACSVWCVAFSEKSSFQTAWCHSIFVFFESWSLHNCTALKVSSKTLYITATRAEHCTNTILFQNFIDSSDEFAILITNCLPEKTSTTPCTTSASLFWTDLSWAATNCGLSELVCTEAKTSNSPGIVYCLTSLHGRCAFSTSTRSSGLSTVFACRATSECVSSAIGLESVGKTIPRYGVHTFYVLIYKRRVQLHVHR